MLGFGPFLDHGGTPCCLTASLPWFDDVQMWPLFTCKSSAALLPSVQLRSSSRQAELLVFQLLASILLDTQPHAISVSCPAIWYELPVALLLMSTAFETMFHSNLKTVHFN